MSSTRDPRLTLNTIYWNGSVGEAICKTAIAFRQGAITDPATVRICNSDGCSFISDVRVTVWWPDGSVKWARLMWIATGPQTFHIDWPSRSDAILAETSEKRTAASDTSAGASGLRPTPMAELGSIVPLAMALEIVSVDGSRQNESIAIPAFQGPDQRRALGAILRQGTLGDEISRTQGENFLVSSTTVESFDELQLQRWMVTLRNPRAARHPGNIWELGDPRSAEIESARIVIRRLAADGRHHRVSKVHVKMHPSRAWRASTSPWRLHQQGSGGENFQSLVHVDRDGRIPVAALGFVASGGESQGDNKYCGVRATPSVICEWADGAAVGVFISKFWQQFPKAIGVQDDEITVDIFPRECDVVHELQPGEQTSLEFWLGTGTTDEVRQRLDAAASSRSVRSDPFIFCQTAAIPWLTPRDQAVSPEFAKYLRLVDQAVVGIASLSSKRERIDEYGWRNFGDAFADHESAYNDPDHLFVSHYNNQYDMIFGLGVQFLTGGNTEYFELMQDLARHVIDIDIYHTDQDLPCYNHGLFWHTAHYVDAGLSTHRGYPRGTCGGGPSSGHAYARGLLLYYSLTADPAAREAVEKMGEWMIAAEDGRYTRYRWLAGGETGLTSASGLESYHGPGRGSGNAIEVLLATFELTQQRRFLNQCEVLVRRCVHPEQDPTSLDLLDVENKWFYLIFLQALGRYLEVKISLNEIDSMYAYGQCTLLRYADWMAEHERPFLTEPEKLEFPNETWAAQDIRKTEVFQWAARHTSGERRERYLERAQWFFKHSIEELDGFETKGLCRPIALLLANGYSYEFFRTGGLDTFPAAPQAPATSFPPHSIFYSQKTRAIANLKRLVLLAAVASAGIVFGGAWWWTHQ